MAYNRQTWTDGATGGTPLSAARMNYLETGLSTVATTVDSLSAGGGSSSASPGAVSVLTYGAVGDGSTDSTAGINAAITANPGKTIIVPNGTYMINAGASTGAGGQPVGIKMNQAKTRLELSPGAILKVISNNKPNHSPIQVTAADCVISGGTLIGDIRTHTDTGGGVFGYGIDINAGADRCLVKDITVTEMFGDGIMVMGRCSDVTLENVTATYNKRQGCSVIDSIRTRIIGGLYAHTGRLGLDDPAAGIDLEPDPDTARDVIDCLLVGVTFADNRGPGFCSSSNGRTLTATVIGCRSTGNGDSPNDWTGEYRMYGATNKTRLIGCTAERSLVGDGFFITPDTVGIQFLNCTASNNPGHGFNLTGTKPMLTGCVATSNGGNGVASPNTTPGPLITSMIASGNGTGGVFTNQFDIWSPSSRLVGCVADAGGNAASQFGYVIRTSATGVKVIGSTALGTFTQGNYIAQAGDAVLSPTP